MVSANSFSIVVADEEPVMRHGLASLIERCGLVLDGEAGCARSARELCAKHQPQVLVVDVALTDGFILIKDLPRVAAKTRVVVLTGLMDTISLQRAFQVGAQGYACKRDPLAAVMQVIINVAEGRRAMGPLAEGIFLASLATGGMSLRGDEVEALSNRELQVFRLMGRGRGTQEMAAELHLSRKTVESHKQRIKEKLQLRTGTELQQRAVLYANASGKGLPPRLQGSKGEGR